MSEHCENQPLLTYTDSVNNLVRKTQTCVCVSVLCQKQHRWVNADYDGCLWNKLQVSARIWNQWLTEKKEVNLKTDGGLGQDSRSGKTVKTSSFWFLQKTSPWTMTSSDGHVMINCRWKMNHGSSFLMAFDTLHQLRLTGDWAPAARVTVYYWGSPSLT